MLGGGCQGRAVHLSHDTGNVAQGHSDGFGRGECGFRVEAEPLTVLLGLHQLNRSPGRRRTNGLSLPSTKFHL